MSKCDHCIEWECSEIGSFCFCMQRTEKIPEDEDCDFFYDTNTRENKNE